MVETIFRMKFGVVWDISGNRKHENLAITCKDASVGLMHMKEYPEKVFSRLGLDWQEYVETDPYYFRPTEVDSLLGDSSKARNTLNWKPTVGFQEVIRIMTEYDLDLAEREAHALQFRK